MKIRLDKNEATIYRLEQSILKQGQVITELQNRTRRNLNEEEQAAIDDFFNRLGAMFAKIDTAVAWHARTSYPTLRELNSKLSTIRNLIINQ